MTRVLHHIAREVAATHPQFEVTDKQHPDYHEIDTHVAYVTEEIGKYHRSRDPSFRNEAKARELAQRGLLLAKYLPRLQAENLVVDIAASTQDPEAIDIAHKVIAELYESDEERRGRAHKLANYTIAHSADTEGMDIPAAGVQALVDDLRERDIDPDESLRRLMVDEAMKNEHDNMRHQRERWIAASNDTDLPTGAVARPSRKEPLVQLLD